MYDELTATYTLRCPDRDGVKVRLSSFRRVERIPGPARPAVFRVHFACPCGDEHVAMVAHDALDWLPVVGGDVLYLDLMTGRREPANRELVDRAASQIARGTWPWTLYCVWESRARPVYPSSFRVLAPRRDALLVGARCPSCARSSINVCTVDHVDVPFFNDREVGVVERPVDDPAALDDVIGALAAASTAASPRQLAA